MKIEEVKQKYEEEIRRLSEDAQAYQAKCQEIYNVLESKKKELVDTFNEEMQRVTIGIERLRGAYTALCDMEEEKEPTLVTNKMEVSESPQVEIPEIPVNNTQPEVVDDSAVIGKEPENEISDEVKEKAKEVVAKAKEAGHVTKYEDFVETDLAKETSLSAEEIEALSKIAAEDTNSTASANTQQVKAEEVPDYLKEQYGLK